MATPFSLKFCIIFYGTLRKIKGIYIVGKWASVPVTPFLSFLDAPLLTVAKLTFPQPVPE